MTNEQTKQIATAIIVGAVIIAWTINPPTFSIDDFFILLAIGTAALAIFAVYTLCGFIRRAMSGISNLIAPPLKIVSGTLGNIGNRLLRVVEKTIITLVVIYVCVVSCIFIWAVTTKP